MSVFGQGAEVSDSAFFFIPGKEHISFTAFAVEPLLQHG